MSINDTSKRAIKLKMKILEVKILLRLLIRMALRITNDRKMEDTKFEYQYLNKCIKS